MAPSTTDLSVALQRIPEKREFLRKAFGDLEEQGAGIGRCSGGWKELDSRLSAIYDALQKRYAGIVDKESKFEARMVETQAALDERQSVIESREQASLSRVQEQKDSAVAAIREQKRKWVEERQLLQGQNPAKPDPDSAGAKPKQKDSKVKKDEAGKLKSFGNEKDDVSSKKKDDTDAKTSSNQKEGANSRLEKVKANSSTTAHKSAEVSISKCKEEAVCKQGSAEKNSDDLENRSEAMEIGDDGNKSGDDDGSGEDEKEGSHKKVESSQSAITVRPELTSFCEKMDGPGLYSFLISQKKSLKIIRKELPVAMKCASDPPLLVFLAIKDHHSSESGSGNAQVKKLASRRSCLILLESLSAVLIGEGKAGNGVSEEVRDEAKKVSELWNSKLNLKEGDLSAQLDAHSFLELVAAFGLTSNFSEDELCEVVVPICFRKQVPKLWRKLGLAHKASEVVDRLIKGEKQIEAVTFIQEYQLAEKFDPIALLKAYLREARKGHTKSSTPEEKDVLHSKELNAAKEVLKCVEKYKLEEKYQVEGLRKRIVQLETLLSSEKKRTSETNTSSSAKKARPNGPGGGPPFRSSDRFGGRGMGGHPYGGLSFGRGGRGGYPYPAGESVYPSTYSHGNYHYGGGPPSYQGPYLS